MNEQGDFAVGSRDLIAVAGGLHEVGAAVAAHHFLHSNQRIAATPELNRVQDNSINGDANRSYNGLQNQADDTVDNLGARHVALPFLILVKEGERTDARAGQETACE